MTGMTEVKVADLVGPALDWAVAQAEGLPALLYPCDPPYVYIDLPGRGCGPYHPSHNWSQGGPLIEMYQLDFSVEHPQTIGAALCDENGMYIDDRIMFGETHLIAACRAIAAVKLGTTVSIPVELVNP